MRKTFGKVENLETPNKVKSSFYHQILKVTMGGSFMLMQNRQTRTESQDMASPTNFISYRFLDCFQRNMVRGPLHLN